MNILWVTNISIYDFKQELNRSISNSGGWIQEFYKFFENNKRNNIIVCSFDVNIKKTICSIKDNSSHYLIPKDIKNPCKYDCSVEKELEMIILKENPDIIHIWGTEFAHSLSALKVAKRLEIKNIISIQGLISNCANHYCDGIPRRVLRRYTFRDFIRMDNLLQQQKKFEQRGIFESNSLEIAKNVIGRTDYDYSYIKTKYKDIDYYFCNECLREEFYNYKWNVNNIDRHTIFISQASYPIKGFHYFLAGLKIIKERFPDVKAYVAGGESVFLKSFTQKIKESSYNRYIRMEITKLNLKDNIVYLGNLNSTQMVETYMKSNVFVSPSLIENSSNSIGEAMILGMPIVSSFVGGVGNMIEHKKSALLYPQNEPMMMAQYIINVFENDDIAIKIGIEAKKNAEIIFNKKKNTSQMENIYEKVLQQK